MLMLLMSLVISLCRFYVWIWSVWQACVVERVVGLSWLLGVDISLMSVATESLPFGMSFLGSFP